MPRSARRQYPGAKYHVTNRGNGGLPIFYGRDDYERCLGQLHDALQRDRVVLFAYCLMPTHIHLFVETPAANLDRFMARFTTAYAMYFRYKHYRPGHCFQGRYHAPLVAGDDYILRLTRYIHLNPARDGGGGSGSAAQNWERVCRYRWSSLGGYLEGGRADGPVDYRWLRLVDERGGTAAGRAYGRYLRQVLGGDDEVLDEAMKASRYAIGDAAFRAEVEEWVHEESRQWVARSDLYVPPPTPEPFDRLAALVAEEFAVEASALCSARTRVGWARAVLLELACTVGGLRQRAAAHALGTLGEHAVSKQRQQLHAALPRDAELQARLARLRARLKSKV